MHTTPSMLSPHQIYVLAAWRAFHVQISHRLVRGASGQHKFIKGIEPEAVDLCLVRLNLLRPRCTHSNVRRRAEVKGNAERYPQQCPCLPHVQAWDGRKCAQRTSEEADSQRCLVSQMISCLSSPTEPKMCEWWLCHATSCSVHIRLQPLGPMIQRTRSVPFPKSNRLGSCSLRLIRQLLIRVKVLFCSPPARTGRGINACAHVCRA